MLKKLENIRMEAYCLKTTKNNKKRLFSMNIKNLLFYKKFIYMHNHVETAINFLPTENNYK